MPFIQTQGPTVILTATQRTSSVAGSTTHTGSWYTIHPSLGRFFITAKLTGSSVGSTATADVYLDVSNDGSIACSTPVLTFVGMTTTDTSTNYQNLGTAIPTSLQAHYGYIRARISTFTSGTLLSSASPTPTVAGNVVVTLNSGYVGFM
jgi:hypothetical protein